MSVPFTGPGFYRIQTERGTSVLWCAEHRGDGGRLWIGCWRTQRHAGDATKAAMLLAPEQFAVACTGMISTLAGG